MCGAPCTPVRNLTRVISEKHQTTWCENQRTKQWTLLVKLVAFHVCPVCHFAGSHGKQTWHLFSTAPQRTRQPQHPKSLDVPLTSNSHHMTSFGRPCDTTKCPNQKASEFYNNFWKASVKSGNHWLLSTSRQLRWVGTTGASRSAGFPKFPVVLTHLREQWSSRSVSNGKPIDQPRPRVIIGVF